MGVWGCNPHAGGIAPCTSVPYQSPLKFSDKDIEFTGNLRGLVSEVGIVEWTQPIKVSLLHQFGQFRVNRWLQLPNNRLQSHR
jgi:hypothetical protein